MKHPPFSSLQKGVPEKSSMVETVSLCSQNNIQYLCNKTAISLANAIANFTPAQFPYYLKVRPTTNTIVVPNDVVACYFLCLDKFALKPATRSFFFDR